MAADDASGRLEIVAGKPLAQGWTGKLWAVEQGVRHARSVAPGATYLLLTDADIEHDAGNLRRLVAKAEAETLDLVSLMARLRCETFWERLLIPAFVFFFQKLYPFPWVNDPERDEAAAAGGCMLIRRAALERCGGVASIRDRIIDDCALAARIKGHGSIWLGLAGKTRSLRGYHRLADIWTMVARTAFAQLGHSVLALAGIGVAMVVVYGLPSALAIFGLFEHGYATFVVATAAWMIMMQAYRPTLRLYGLKPWRASLLPVAALLFTLMTVDSAWRYRKGKGGAWKGRHYGWLRKADG